MLPNSDIKPGLEGIRVGQQRRHGVGKERLFQAKVKCTKTQRPKEYYVFNDLNIIQYGERVQ